MSFLKPLWTSYWFAQRGLASSFIDFFTYRNESILFWWCQCQCNRNVLTCSGIDSGLLNNCPFDCSTCDGPIVEIEIWATRCECICRSSRLTSAFIDPTTKHHAWDLENPPAFELWRQAGLGRPGAWIQGFNTPRTRLAWFIWTWRTNFLKVALPPDLIHPHSQMARLLALAANSFLKAFTAWTVFDGSQLETASFPIPPAPPKPRYDWRYVNLSLGATRQ